MFKRQQTESPYIKSVTFTETVFIKRRLLKNFVKIWNTELHENSTDFLSLMASDRRNNCRLCCANNTFIIYKGIYQSCAHVTGSSEWWRIKVRFIVAESIKNCWLTGKSVIFARSQFTLSLVTKPIEKLTVKFLCDKQGNQFMLQGGVLDYRQHAEYHSDW